MLKADYQGYNGGNGRSPNLWKDLPADHLDPNIAYGVFDDFADFGLIGTQTTQIRHQRYKVFNTGSGTVAGAVSVNSVMIPGGILSIGVDTANDSGSIAHAYPSFFLSGDPATSGKLWFEARIAYSPIVTNGIGWFLGLAEVDKWTLATGVPFNGGDAITNSASAIGFRKPEDDTTEIDTVYSDRATSFTEVGGAEGSYPTAFAFTKLGMKYDPTLGDECIQFFQDGVPLATGVSRSTLTGLTNLDANLVSPMLSVIADSAGTAGLVFMDWWSCFQMRV